MNQPQVTTNKLRFHMYWYIHLKFWSRDTMKFFRIWIGNFQVHFELSRSGLKFKSCNQNLQDEIEKGSFTQLPKLMIFGILGFLLSPWGWIWVPSPRSCAKASCAKKHWFSALWRRLLGSSAFACCSAFCFFACCAICFQVYSVAVKGRVLRTPLGHDLCSCHERVGSSI